MSDIFFELKRRNVFKVGVAYAVVAWVILQFVDIVQEPMNLPEWFQRVTIVLLAIGFPVSLVLSWAYELTPQGIKKTAEVKKSKSITPKTGQKLNRLIAGTLALALAFIAYDKLVAPGGAPVRQAEAGQASIAVLPFVNMSDDPSNEYFADGLSEEILNVLAKVPNLKVAGRTSSFQFKGENLDLREIGSTLGVDTVLEGSVRKQGNRVRITAQLVRTTDGFHLWSETYNRDLADIFQVQDDISAAIFKALSVTLNLSGHEVSDSPPTTNIAAYDRYLEARALIARRGFENLKRAAQALEEAIQLDPAFAEAWAVLSQAYALIPYYGPAPRETYIPRAETAARRALALDPDLAPAHVGLANALGDQGDLVEAEAEYKKALALNPNDVEGNSQYSQFLQAVGKSAEALPYAVKAYEADPLSFVYAAVASGIYHGVGNHDQERASIERSVQLDNTGLAPMVAVALGLAHGDSETAIEMTPAGAQFDARQAYMAGLAEGLKPLLYDRAAASAYLRKAFGAYEKSNDLSQGWIFWMWALHYRDNDLALQAMNLDLDPTGFGGAQFFWIFRNPELMADKRIRDFLGVKTGYLAYWKQNGFPEGCGASGEADFECKP